MNQVTETDPYALFAVWSHEAQRDEGDMAHTISVATVDASGRPSQRMVYFRGMDSGGFCFYTNYDGRKSRDLAQDPNAAILFYWPRARRQVRLQGVVRKLSAERSDRYFAGRTRESQIGSWASLQSQPLPDRQTLMDRFADFERRFEGKPVPRPEGWGGFVLDPNYFEFWQGAPHRLHHRIVYTREGEHWRRSMLYP